MTMMHNPPHPGEFINETYLEPLNVSIRKAAIKLAVSPSTFESITIKSMGCKTVIRKENTL